MKTNGIKISLNDKVTVNGNKFTATRIMDGAIDLKGLRGGVRHLVQNKHNPDLVYVIDSRKSVIVRSISLGW